MSLGRLNTTEAYAETASVANETLNLLEHKLMDATGTSSMIDAVIAKLQEVINQLKNEEQEILKAFGVTSENQLQKKFQDFYTKTGLINLSGINVKQAFLEEYKISLEKNMKEVQDLLDQLLPNLISSIKQASLEVTEENVKKAFNEWLSNTVVTLNLASGITNTRSGKLVKIDENGMMRLMASRLTKEQKRRINLLKNKTKTLGNPLISGDIFNNNNTMTIAITAQWYDLTLNGMSQSQIQKCIAEGKITRDQFNIINKKITNLICSQVKQSGLVKAYINQMLTKDPYIFFVGKNVNDITGILGEISAVIAISELMPNVDSSKIIRWVANEKVGTKKLSIDILLEGLGNVQVKNTSLNTGTIPEINIDFAQGNVETIMNRLGQWYDWDADIITSVLESESFNIPVKAAGHDGYQATQIDTSFTGAAPKDWSKFVDAYNLMTSVISKTHTFLTGYAPDFLYISGPTNFKQQLAVLDHSLQGFVGRGIHLYVVAGVPHLASSQLEVIQKDLYNLQHLKETSLHFNINTALSTVGEKGIPYNYVAYKNGLGAKAAKMTSSMSMGVQ